MTVRRIFWAMILAACAVSMVAPVLASSAAVDVNAYALLSWTTAPGGSLQGGAFMLSGSAGQPAAGPATGAAYEVNGGFWQITAASHGLYLPAIRK